MMVFSDNQAVLLPSVKIESERERHATERLDDPTTFLTTTTTTWIQRGRKRSRDPNSSFFFDMISYVV